MAQSRDNRRPAYVIVVGHEADRCGGTTVCLHLAVALMQRAQRVMLIDLDGRRKGLTSAIANRLGFAGRTGLRPLTPSYAYLGGAGHSVADLARAFSSVEEEHDFVIVDSSGSDPNLSQLLYSLADTLILPFTPPELDIAIDVTADAEIFASGGFRSLGAAIHEARRARRIFDDQASDVVVLHNRVSKAGMDVTGRFEERLDRAAMEYGFRTVEGLHEREAYRRWMDQGLTVFDQGDEIAGSACLAEAHAMIEDFRLPLNEATRKRAVARAQWIEASAQPLLMDEMLAS